MEFCFKEVSKLDWEVCDQRKPRGVQPPLGSWLIPQLLPQSPISVLPLGATSQPWQGSPGSVLPCPSVLPLHLPGSSPALVCAGSSVLFWDPPGICTCSSIHLLTQCSLPDGWLYSFIKLSCSNSSRKIQFRRSIVKNSVSLSTLLSPHFFCHLTPIMGC